MTASYYFKDFSGEIGSDTKDYDILIPCNEMCEDLFKEQGRIMNFNIEYKMFIDLVSDSTLQLAFKKLSLAKFWVVSKAKNIPSYLKRLLKCSLFQLHITVKPDLLIFQRNSVS